MASFVISLLSFSPPHNTLCQKDAPIWEEALRENPKNKCKVLKLGEMGKFNALRSYIFFSEGHLVWDGLEGISLLNRRHHPHIDPNYF